jgi:two-component system response regulator AgrA
MCVNPPTPARHIPVYYLEDEPAQLNTTTALIKTLASTAHIAIEVQYAGASPRDLLCVFKEQHYQPGIFFLDIELAANSDEGIQVAEQLRFLSSGSQIIFLTARPDKSLAILQHNVVPRALIAKSELQEREYAHLAAVLQQAAADIASQPTAIGRQIRFEESGNHFSLPIYSVDYIETLPERGGILRLYTAKSVHEFRDRIKSVQENFPELVKASQSCLVNPRNIQSFDRKKFLLTFNDGYQIYVARRASRKVQQAWDEFLDKQ